MEVISETAEYILFLCPRSFEASSESNLEVRWDFLPPSLSASASYAGRVDFLKFTTSFFVQAMTSRRRGDVQYADAKTQDVCSHYLFLGVLTSVSARVTYVVLLARLP